MQLEYVCKHFSQLSTAELYAVLQLRIDVFIVEQNCPYADADNKDQEAWHLLGLKGDELVTYARLLAPGVSYPEASIGRVIVKQNYRSQQLGYSLMKKAREEVARLYATQKITISAQHHLEKFYGRLGFVSQSEVYLEDNIPHVKMTLNALPS